MVQARWLTEDEQQVWRAFLAASTRLLAALEGQLQRDAGMPHAYYEILVRLSEAPDRRLRMRDLASASLSSKSRLSHAVDRLEERGWVRRCECPEDRRGQFAFLTDEGFAALSAAAVGHVNQVRACLLDALTEAQQRQLGELATAINRRLDELGEPGTPRVPARSGNSQLTPR